MVDPRIRRRARGRVTRRPLALAGDRALVACRVASYGSVGHAVDRGRQRLRATGARFANRRGAGRPNVSRRIRQCRRRNDVRFRSEPRVKSARYRSHSEHRTRAKNRRGLAGRSLGRAAALDRCHRPAHVSSLRLSADRRRGRFAPRRHLLGRSNGTLAPRSRAQGVLVERFARAAYAALVDQADARDRLGSSRSRGPRTLHSASARAGRPAHRTRRSAARTGARRIGAAQASPARRRSGRSRSPDRRVVRTAGFEQRDRARAYDAAPRAC